jgi:hypothetical protein
LKVSAGNMGLPIAPSNSGWTTVEIIDDDLGRSGGGIARPGFERLLDPARPVFVDETCTTTAMVRLRGRCPRGVRLVGYAPQGHGPMTGEIFLAYIEQCLAPTFARGDIVFLDSLPVHKVAGVKEAIEAAGATLVYYIFRPIRPTSTQSSRPSANSKRICARRPKKRFRAWCAGSAAS